MKPNEFL